MQNSLVRMLGQIIGGKYRVVRLLGAGGMGAVYEVQQMDVLRRAALKILTLDVKSQPGHFQRFMNEARAVNQISHPGVVQVHDFGVDEKGQPWLVMEYLEGSPTGPRHSPSGDGAGGLRRTVLVRARAHREHDLPREGVAVPPDERYRHRDGSHPEASVRSAHLRGSLLRKSRRSL